MGQTFRKQATPFTQTERKGWVLTLTAQETTGLLPKRKPEQLGLFTETNRPVTGRHMESIERFLEETPDWALPSIILAVTPGNVAQEAGAISVDTDQIRVLDGQHRIEALSNLIHRWQIAAPRDDTNETRKRLDAILVQELPAVIFEVRDNRDQRQLFAWFARNKPIEPAVREFFDESDPFNKAAKAAMDQSALLRDSVTWKTTNLPGKGEDSSKLLTLNQIKQIAATVRIGIRRAPKPADREACREKKVQQELQDNLVEFFDRFLPECLPNYQALSNLELLDRNIKTDRNVSYACHFPVMRLAANVWARWKLDRKQDPENLAPVIGKLDLRSADPDNALEKELGVMTGTKKFQKARDKSWEEATAGILQKAAAE